MRSKSQIEKIIKRKTKHIHCKNCREAKQNRLRRKYKMRINASILPDTPQDSPESITFKR